MNLILGLLLSLNSVHADMLITTPTATMQDYKEYTANLMRLMKDNPNMSTQEMVQLAAGMQVKDFAMVEEAKLFKGSQTFAIPSDVQQLQILIADKEGIEIKTGDQARVTVTVYASKSQDEVTSLLSEVGFAGQSPKLSLTSNARSYVCMRTYSSNSGLSVGGACYQHVTIELPVNSPILIRDKEQRLNHLDQPLDKVEIFSELESANSFHRADKLTKILDSDANLNLSGGDVVKILELLTSFDRKAAVKKMLPKIAPLTASDVNLILAELTSFDRLEVFKLLAGKTIKAERTSLKAVINEQLTSFDRNEAFSALIDLLQ